MMDKKVFSIFGCFAILIIYASFWSFVASAYVAKSSPIQCTTIHCSQELQHIEHKVDPFTIHRINVRLAHRNRYLHTIKAFFLAEGAVEVRSTRHRTALVVHILVGTLEKLLGVKMARFDLDHQRSIIRSVVPYRIPPHIAFGVESIRGLTDFPAAVHIPEEPSNALVPHGYHASVGVQSTQMLPAGDTAAFHRQLPTSATLTMELPSPIPASTVSTTTLSPFASQSTPTFALGLLTLMLPLSTLPALLALFHLHTLYLEFFTPQGAAAPSTRSIKTVQVQDAAAVAVLHSRLGKARRRKGLKDHRSPPTIIPNNKQGTTTATGLHLLKEVNKLSPGSFADESSLKGELCFDPPLSTSSAEDPLSDSPDREQGPTMMSGDKDVAVTLGKQQCVEARTDQAHSGGGALIENKIIQAVVESTPSQALEGARVSGHLDRWHAKSAPKAVQCLQEEDPFIFPEFASFVCRDVVSALSAAERALLTPASFL